MAYSADAIANFFLDKAAQVNSALTHLQVQKLIYFAHGWYLALDPAGRPLIDELLEAWKHGPVVRSIYREFAKWGGNPIEEKAKELNPETLEIYEPSVEQEAPDDLDRDLARRVLERIWEVYGHFDGYRLASLTHQPGEPWQIIHDKFGGQIPRGIHIPNELIRKCFLQKMQRRQ